MNESDELHQVYAESIASHMRLYHGVIERDWQHDRGVRAVAKVPLSGRAARNIDASEHFTSNNTHRLSPRTKPSQ